MAEALGVLGRAMSVSAIHIHLVGHSLKTAVVLYITDSLQLQKVLIDHFLSNFENHLLKLLANLLTGSFVSFFVLYIHL